MMTVELGSSTVEVDDTGAVISYEEYHPYGTTALRISNGNAEVSAKRYRYTGKERDEETGLYYHGARYYAPWLGRWTAADPAGMADGVNLYSYVSNSPVRLNDPNGTDGQDGLGFWEQLKRTAALLFILETHQTPSQFGKGVVQKAKSVTVDPVWRIYGPGGMCSKAGEKLADKALGEPDRNYVTREEHQQMLSDIFAVSGLLFPGVGGMSIGVPRPPLVTAGADALIAQTTSIAVPNALSKAPALAMAATGDNTPPPAAPSPSEKPDTASAEGRTESSHQAPKEVTGTGAEVASPATERTTLTAGKNFKQHFIDHRAAVEKALGIKVGKLKEGGGEALLKALGEGIDKGTFKFIGQGTLRKGGEAMNIYRGNGLTVVTKSGGEWVTALKSGEGLDLAIQMLR